MAVSTSQRRSAGSGTSGLCDAALRDVGLAPGALAAVRLAVVYDASGR